MLLLLFFLFLLLWLWLFCFSFQKSKHQKQTEKLWKTTTNNNNNILQHIYRQKKMKHNIFLCFNFFLRFFLFFSFVLFFFFFKPLEKYRIFIYVFFFLCFFLINVDQNLWGKCVGNLSLKVLLCNAVARRNKSIDSIKVNLNCVIWMLHNT